jgi:predicted alpha/beta superfamily hydrolase
MCIESFAINSTILEDERQVYVYLPPEVEETEELPVIYMQDGQNVFSPHPEGWGLNETATELISHGAILPLIIVGIANSPWRDDEYTPSFDVYEGCGGFADHYLSFLTDEVFPLVEENYPVSSTREGRAIGGSSLGGLLALYAVISRPEIFSRAAILSPSLWWNERDVFDEIEQWQASPSDFRLWFDMGYWEYDEEDEADEEPHPIEDTDFLCQLLEDKGFTQGLDFQYITDEEGGHDEESWGKRMEAVLPFLFSI